MRLDTLEVEYIVKIVNIWPFIKSGHLMSKWSILRNIIAEFVMRPFQNYHEEKIYFTLVFIFITHSLILVGKYNLFGTLASFWKYFFDI